MYYLYPYDANDVYLEIQCTAKYYLCLWRGDWSGEVKAKHFWIFLTTLLFICREMLLWLTFYLSFLTLSPPENVHYALILCRFSNTYSYYSDYWLLAIISRFLSKHCLIEQIYRIYYNVLFYSKFIVID